MKYPSLLIKAFVGLLACFLTLKAEAQKVNLPSDSTLQKAIEKGIAYMEMPNSDLEISVCFLYDMLQRSHQKAFLNVQ